MLRREGQISQIISSNSIHYLNTISTTIFRDFIETILIKEDFDDPKERARRAAAKRKQKEEEAAKAKQNRMVTLPQQTTNNLSFNLFVV